MFEAGTTLTGIVQEVLYASDEDLADALERARSSCDYAALIEEKRRLETEGKQAALDAAEEIVAGEALFTIDYSGVEGASVAWSLSPFGITRVDDRRTIYQDRPRLRSHRRPRHGEADRRVACAP